VPSCQTPSRALQNTVRHRPPRTLRPSSSFPRLVSPLHLPPYPADILLLHTAPPPPKQHLASTQDLLARFHLLPAYDRYVRPFTLPGDDPALQQQPDDPSLSGLASTPATGSAGHVDKGKGRERDSAVATPAEADPADGGDADDDDVPGAKGEKKKKNTYRHLIKGIPGVFLFFIFIFCNLVSLCLFLPCSSAWEDSKLTFLSRQALSQKRRLSHNNDARPSQATHANIPL